MSEKQASEGHCQHWPLQRSINHLIIKNVTSS